MTARLTEADLIRAVGRPLRVAQCSCGGTISAIDGDWDDVSKAIRLHNDTPRHQAWRRWIDAAD